MSINVFTISGNLTRDAELAATRSGTAVLSFSVAVNERRKNQQTGQWEDYANYIDCTVFGQRAQALQPMMVKGTRVCVTGHMHWSSWEKDGQKRSKVEGVVEEIVIMSQRSAEPQPAAQYQEALPAYADEDLPF